MRYKKVKLDATTHTSYSKLAPKLLVMSENNTNTVSTESTDDQQKTEQEIKQEGEPETGPKSSLLRSFSYGLCMGTADAVPGVSGGTIALILGYYDQFIDALSQVIGIARNPFERTRWNAARPAFYFLIPLGIGLMSALFVATKLLVGKVAGNAHELESMNTDELRQFLNAHPPQGLLLNPETAPYVFALFFGLVLFSIAQPWKMIRQHKIRDYFLAIAGATTVAIISLCSPASLGVNPLSLIIAGMLAISVMLLPGISGSLVLLIIGMYQPVSQALNGFLSDISAGNGEGIYSNGMILVYFICGIVLGIMSFVPLLKLLLQRFHDRSMAILTGLMCGSLVALWPWKAHYLPKHIDTLGPMLPQIPNASGSLLLAVTCMLVGMGGIYGLSRLSKSRLAKK